MNTPTANDTLNAETQAFLSGLEADLWRAADKLRAELDAANYKHIVLGLIFLKYISDTSPRSANKSNKTCATPRATTTSTPPTSPPPPPTTKPSPPNSKTATTTPKTSPSGYRARRAGTKSRAL